MCGALVFIVLFPYVLLNFTPPSVLDMSTMEKWMYSPDAGRLDYALEKLSD